MTLYRSLLAAVAAVAIASPVFADDATPANTDNNTAPAAQTMDNGSQPTQTASADQASSKINLNTASAKELVKVKGLNASKARAIVAYRKKHGSFKSMDELNKVKGFSKTKAEDMQSIQDQLTVG